MLKVLIVDDEEKAHNVLQYHIRAVAPQITEVRSAYSVDDAIQELDSYKPDIVFLDVEMPHRNGFELILAIKDIKFDIIFTTAFNQYAIQAIRFSALDYLLKPIDPTELVAAIARYERKREEKVSNRPLLNNLIENIKQSRPDSFRLAVSSREGTYFFELSKVIRLQADLNYTKICIVGQRPLMECKTLKHYEDMLSSCDFIRTHKSHLVNRMHVVKMVSSPDGLQLTNGEIVEVSRRKKESVIEFLATGQ